MEKEQLQQKIYSLIDKVQFLPLHIREEIRKVVPSCEGKDLTSILEMLITWDQEVAKVYKEQSNKIADLTKQIRAEKVA